MLIAIIVTAVIIVSVILFGGVLLFIKAYLDR